MNEIKSVEWFKRDIAPELEGYDFEYKFFEQGDFGPLSQVVFNSKKMGGNIDFWGQGWLGIFVWDFQKEQQIINILLAPNQEEEKERIFKDLYTLIKVTP